MKKSKKLELKNSLENNEYVLENNEFLFRKLMFNPLLRIGGMLILLIFSLLNNERIIHLAKITSNSLVSNEWMFGPVTYYTVLGVTIGLCLLTSLAVVLAKPHLDMASISVLRTTYKIFSVYDLVVFILSTFVCLFFIVMILLTPCNISGNSMNNTFQDGDRVLIWNIGYQPVRNDVVVFDATDYSSASSQTFFIKRIIAKENDRIDYQVKDAHSGWLYVNDLYVQEVFKWEYENLYPEGLSFSNSFLMPKDKILVMGDNRSNSTDSRSFGLVDEKDIVGKVLFRFYPFQKIGNPSPEILH